MYTVPHHGAVLPSSTGLGRLAAGASSKDNVYRVQGKHLERIGMCSDQPLYFTVQPKLSAKSSGTAKRSRGD